MKVLIVGNGGREHALAWKIRQSPLLTKLYCVPGNAGTAEIAENVDLDVSQLGGLALWAVKNEIDLTIVGPEAPLADGLVDVFSEHGLKVFGPTKAAAQLESSKWFSKDVMFKAGVKTAAAEVFTEFEAAKAYVEKQGAPIVVKADGLAAGKGVVVAETTAQAIEALEHCLVKGKLGSAGNSVVVEEFLDGREASVMAIVDGDTVLPLVISQDFKRLLDGDEGPNTGGMGAISPTPVLEDKGIENLVGDIFLPVINELLSRGIAYRGFLYAGVMLGKNGEINILEFNCRLGDPETQPLMMRLQSDLLAVLDATVNGKLASVDLKWRPEAAACIVAASQGYPGPVSDGVEIKGIFDGDDRVNVFQAGTRRDPSQPEKLLSKGGRVLSVTALGATLNEAIKNAYAGMEKIKFEGMHYRRDIGGGHW